MSVRTRRTAAVTAGLSLAAALTLALPGTASASTAATILSKSSYADSAGYQHIVGEVEDTGTTNIDSPQLAFNFYDASGTLLDTDFTFASVDRMTPGEKSPFHEIFTPPAGYDHYSVTISAPATTAVPNHNFTTTVTNEFTDSSAGKHIVGTIRNDNTTTAEFVQAVLTLYDGAGSVVDSDFTFVNTDSNSTLAPGQTASFEAAGFEGPAYASYAILTQSSTPASPASAAPTPTPTPTGASPAPSGSSTAPETTPTLSVSPAVISAGQLVTVTYHGTPNSTLEIWSKTQPSTAYSQIRTVTLDATGTGTSTHSPRRNTRIMAKTAGGLASTQPLISVRSIASVNAKRVGTRTFTFSGSVLPALNNRLVNLYRNGTLVAQARTGATGVYTVTKTLGAGTSGFQAKTPNDTYNLGATSAVKSVRIY